MSRKEDLKPNVSGGERVRTLEKRFTMASVQPFAEARLAMKSPACLRPWQCTASILQIGELLARSSSVFGVLAAVGRVNNTC